MGHGNFEEMFLLQYDMRGKGFMDSSSLSNGALEFYSYVKQL
jgi:hypothetical protein